MNKVVERFNSTALDDVKTLPNTSGLPQKYFGLKLYCVFYVYGIELAINKIKILLLRRIRFGNPQFLI